MDYKLLGDSTLVGLMAASDEGAFKEIYTRHWQSVYLSALKKLRTKEAAEEMTQNLFLSLWHNRATSQIDNIEAYLKTAIKYRIINYIQASLVRQKHLKYLSRHAPSSISDAECTLICNELAEAIDHAIGQLPEKTREVFRLSRFEHKSIREIAYFMNLSEKSVEYHITQSLKYLRLHLKKHVFFSLALAIYLF